MTMIDPVTLASAVLGWVSSVRSWLNRPAVENHEVSRISVAVVLGLIAWLFLLLVIGVWLKYGIGSIALQTFVTAFLTAFFTVYLSNIINLPYLTVILGWLVGILIGYLLCLFCRRYFPGLRG